MEVVPKKSGDHSNNAYDSGPFIELESIHVKEDTLLSRFSFHESLVPYLTTGLFYAKYDFPLTPIPLSILSIPSLGVLLPLGWLTGAEIRFGKVDARFLDSLPPLAMKFKEMYPQIDFKAKVVAEAVKDETKWSGDKACLLYTGGVDSTASLIRNRERLTSTLTVWGTPDLPLRDVQYWRRFNGSIQPFLRELGVESHVVETNAVDMISQSGIRSNFRNKIPHSLWEDLGFGLSLLSISAPYTYSYQVGTVMISSSHTRRTQIPWGSTLLTDEKVAWGGVNVIHDSYDLEKADKLKQVLVPFIQSQGVYVPLKVCIGRRRARLLSNELNCGQCFKCMITELTIALHGLDPHENGFDISPSSLKALKRNLEAGEFTRRDDEDSWKFIKGNARRVPKDIMSKHAGLGEFLEWFARWDERPKTRRRQIANRLAPLGSRRRDIARAMVSKRENQQDQ